MKISELQELLEKVLSECTYFHSGNVTQDCKVFDVDTKEGDLKYCIYRYRGRGSYQIYNPLSN